jgi:amidohydrolase
MDALPILESADIPYISQNPGVMHACGHDGHMTSLLAAAKVLMANRSRIKGVVKLVFQPAEEGYGGAPEMIKDGCLEEGPQGPKVDSIYGIHLWSPLAVSKVACKDGPFMASSDKFEIEVKGSGGHGAMPQGTVDAIVEAAHLVTSLQTIVSRNKSPMDNGVVTCGTINGGFGHNIIADKVTITGTARSFTPQVQELIKSRMECICCGVGATFGGDIDLKYQYGYPATDNSYPECVQVVKAAARKIIGEADDSIEPLMTMGAEDFSYFLQDRPGCFFFVGAALPGEVRPHHKSVFDFDENAMLISASIFIEIIYSVLA